MTVTFTCTSGATVAACPASVTVSDTDADGEAMIGEMHGQPRPYRRGAVRRPGGCDRPVPRADRHPEPGAVRRQRVGRAARERRRIGSCRAVLRHPVDERARQLHRDVPGDRCRRQPKPAAPGTRWSARGPTISASATTAGGRRVCRGHLSTTPVDGDVHLHGADAAEGRLPRSRGRSRTTRPSAGVTVTGSIEDLFGQSASASLVVRIAHTCLANLDRTALAPVNADGSSVFARNSGVPGGLQRVRRHGQAHRHEGSRQERHAGLEHGASQRLRRERAEVPAVGELLVHQARRAPGPATSRRRS